ncbi:MAG: gliding motility-associated C-terminal domain-containing protein [Bacteroidetes bacterium]|nr:gliding motility-associated C-terminal domain-containing protein [Bacteroidota bacterium]
MRKAYFPLLILAFLFSFPLKNFSQSCFNTGINGSSVNLSCTQTCTNILFQVPHIKSTENYAVTSIPFQPYAWTTTTGTELTSTYIDDQFSDSITLGFPFCFFGGTYSKCVVGSNGIISFDVVSNANQDNAYVLQTGGNPQPIPYAGGSPGSISPAYYPRASIMGAYTDIDPSNSSTTPPADRKIEYRIEGTAPCRTFVASFYHVPYFFCQDSIVTEQIAFHENTGIIEVFLKDKPFACTASTNNGLGIVGIQNWSQNIGIAAPGRNCTQFSTYNEAWRFIPNGATSQFISSELLTLGLTHIANADTATTVSGLLDISFPNFCPGVPSGTKFIIKTTFQSCPSGTPLISLDTITVNQIPNLTAAATHTPSTCGASVGTITATVTGSTGVPPFTYTLNPGGVSNNTGIFTGLPAGPYTIDIVDANLCSVQIHDTVNSVSSLAGTAVATGTACTGVNNGTITATPQGNPPYTFTLTGPGGPYVQSSPIFNNLPSGTFTLTYVDGSNCAGTIPNIVVAAGGTITANQSHTNTSCAGATDGSITITPNTAGTYTYILSPGAITNSTGIFTALAAGTYSVTFTNTATGCTGTVNNISITVGGSITATWAHNQNETCPGAADGIITVTPNPASPGVYTYTMTPAPSGGATNSTGIFTGCAAGVFYNVNFTNTTTGCTGSLTFLFVLAATPVSGTQTHTDANCPGVSDGSITITPSPAGSYTYTIAPPPASGPATNTTGIFNNLAGGTTYSVSFQNAGGCGSSVNNIAINQGAGITGNSSTTATSCTGANDGTATITPAGAGTFTYTISPPPTSGPATNSTGIFNNLADGTYTVNISNAAGCTGVVNNVVVAPGTALTYTSSPNATSCQGANDGSLTVTPTAAGTYTYTITPAPVSGPSTNATGIFNNLAAGTYAVTFTNAAGCSGTAANIVVNPGPGLTASAPSTTATSCLGANNGSVTVTPTVAGTYTYVITPPPASGPATNATGTFNNLAAGTYSVTFTNAAGCAGTVSNIVVNPGPGLSSNNSSTATTCLGATDGTATAAPVVAGTYTYTITPAPVTGPATNATGTFSNLADGAYSITFTNNLGCSGIANITVNAGAAITANSSPNPATSCNGASDGSVTITPTIPGTYTYTITPAPVSGPASNSTGVFANLAAGVYSVSFSNALGCTGTVANININPGPALTANTSPVGTSCPGVDNGSITITPTVAGAYSFTITPAPVTGPATNTTGIFNNLAAGTYSILFSNALGCSNTVSNIVVTQGTAPTGNASTTATSCPTVDDGTITITPVPAGTGGPYTFTITGPSGTFTQNGALSTTFTNLAAGTYTATFVSSSSGCTGTVTSPVITAGPYLTSTFIPVNPPCANINDGSISVTATGSAVAPFTVILTGPGGPYTVTSANPVFSNLAPGTYNYSFTDANGCTGTGGPITLTTHTPLAIAVSMTEPLCFGNANGVISLTASGGLAPYQYAQSPFTNFQSSGTFNNLPQGTYTFRVQDAAGCIKDTTVTLNQPTLLTANAVATAGTCNGNDGQILVTGNNGTPNYSYSLDGTSFQSSNTFIVSGASGTGAPFGNITVQDNNGCLAVAPLVNVTLIDNMGTLFIGNDTTICAEQPVTMQPQVVPQATVFTWSTIPNPILDSTLNDTNIKNPVASPLDTVTYVLVAQWGVCSRTDTMTINVKLKPIPDAGQDTAVCHDKPIAYLHGTASHLSGTVNYEWSDTMHLQTPHAANTLAAPTDTETFTLTVTDNYGCNFSVQDVMVVVVQPPVPAFAGNDTIAVINEPHQLLASGGVSYSWTPSAPLNFSNIQNPLAVLDHDQMFVVTVTDQAGCVGTDNVYVQVYPGPGYHIPTAFTPNGDGLNDRFRVIPAGIAYTDYFRIFNRYGQLVFETNQWLKGWDGSFQGKLQPMGNYVWILKGKDKNGKVIEMKGTVLLIQ